MRQTRCGLVEQEQSRPGRHRTSELDPLQRPERQAGRRPQREAGKTEIAENVHRVLGEALLLAADPDPEWCRCEVGPAATVRADHDVLEHGEAREQGQVLKRPRNTETGDLVSIDIEEVGAIEQHLTRSRFVDPRHDVEHRGLPGAVGADQPADLVFIDRERQVVERDDTTEPHGHFSNIE